MKNLGNHTRHGGRGSEPELFAPCDEHSPIQRRLLHIAAITGVVVTLMITSAGFRDLVLLPFELVHRWVVGPAPPLVMRPGDATWSDFEESPPYAIVAGAAIVCTTVAAVVTTLYAIAFCTWRKLQQQRSHRDE